MKTKTDDKVLNIYFFSTLGIRIDHRMGCWCPTD